MFFDNPLTQQLKTLISQKPVGTEFDAVDVARELFDNPDYSQHVKPVLKELVYISKSTNTLLHTKKIQNELSRNVFKRI
jgi:hypothetical protein